jgi:hypothetical protein
LALAIPSPRTFSHLRQTPADQPRQRGPTSGDLEEVVDIPLPERGQEFVFGREIQIKGSARDLSLVGDVADTSSDNTFFKKRRLNFGNQLFSMDLWRFTNAFQFRS